MLPVSHSPLSYDGKEGAIRSSYAQRIYSGGPNRERQDEGIDGVCYPKNLPADESYLDFQPSYASNEVTINWNVTLFALTAGIDALQQ